jgi:hypothetical protein
LFCETWQFLFSSLPVLFVKPGVSYSVLLWNAAVLGFCRNTQNRQFSDTEFYFIFFSSTWNRLVFDSEGLKVGTNGGNYENQIPFQPQWGPMADLAAVVSLIDQ